MDLGLEKRPFQSTMGLARMPWYCRYQHRVSSIVSSLIPTPLQILERDQLSSPPVVIPWMLSYTQLACTMLGCRFCTILAKKSKHPFKLCAHVVSVAFFPLQRSCKPQSSLPLPSQLQSDGGEIFSGLLHYDLPHSGAASVEDVVKSLTQHSLGYIHSSRDYSTVALLRKSCDIIIT